MTTQLDIEKVVQLGESENLEFKSSFNNELIETLVAFANTNGGKVIIGINSSNEIIGIQLNTGSEKFVENMV